MTEHGGEWKRLYLERNLEDEIEALDENQANLDRLLKVRTPPTPERGVFWPALWDPPAAAPWQQLVFVDRSSPTPGVILPPADHHPVCRACVPASCEGAEIAHGCGASV